MEKFYHNILNVRDYNLKLSGALLGDASMENGRIFLISGDKIMRNYLRSFISHFDQKIHMPSDPENFLDELESVKPSVVVYDILRINPDTFQQLQLLTRLGKSAQVILLSGQVQIPLLQDFAGTTAWKILTKPFLPQEFKTCILEAFGKLRGFVLTPDIFGYLDIALANLREGDELWYNDALKLMLEDGKKVKACVIKGGRYYDTGNKLEYLKTVVEFALEHPDINGSFRKFLKGLEL